MTKKEVLERLENGYKLVVQVKPNKAYNKMILKTKLINKDGYFQYVYYNHVKSFLTDQQLELIDLFKEASILQFRDRVDLNVKIKQDKASEHEIKLFDVWKSLNKMQLIEA